MDWFTKITRRGKFGKCRIVDTENKLQKNALRTRKAGASFLQINTYFPVEISKLKKNQVITWKLWKKKSKLRSNLKGIYFHAYKISIILGIWSSWNSRIFLPTNNTNFFVHEIKYHTYFYVQSSDRHPNVRN